MAKKKSFYDKHRDKINFAIAITLMLAIVFVFSLVKIYFQNTGEVVAKVNGDPIYRQQLEARMEQSGYDKAPKELVLQQIIQEELLLQAIEDSGVEATREELEEKKGEFMRKNGLTEESLEQVLRLQEVTRREFESMLKNTLLLDKFLQKEVYSGIEVTDQEAREYYEANLESFEVPELHEIQQATFTNDTEGHSEKALEVYEVRKDIDDLCRYVREEYANPNCGTFNVSKFSGLPDNLLSTITGLKQGGYAVTETDFGSHVLRKVALHPKTVEPFSAVKRAIVNALKKQRESSAFNEFIAKLRKQADIENYLLDEIVKNVTANQPPTFEETISCISNNSVLYGATWDSQTKKQIELFSNHSINYVDCTRQGFQQTQKCAQEGIEAYPTWEIKGKKVMGFQDVETLAALSGCK